MDQHLSLLNVFLLPFTWHFLSEQYLKHLDMCPAFFDTEHADSHRVALCTVKHLGFNPDRLHVMRSGCTKK